MDSVGYVVLVIHTWDQWFVRSSEMCWDEDACIDCDIWCTDNMVLLELVPSPPRTAPRVYNSSGSVTALLVLTRAIHTKISTSKSAMTLYSLLCFFGSTTYEFLLVLTLQKRKRFYEIICFFLLWWPRTFDWYVYNWFPWRLFVVQANETFMSEIFSIFVSRFQQN